MLLVAVAAGALTMAVLAVVQPQVPTRLPPVSVWVAAVTGAVALAVADTAPTGWHPFDLALRAAFGALVPIAAARAGTVATSWLLVVSVATLFIALDAPHAPVAGVAAGAFWALTAAGSTTPAAAAVAAAAGVGPMAHVDWPVATGASAGAVALATVPVLVVGLARTRRPLRGRITLAVTALVVLLGLGAVAGLAAALSARTDIDRAVDLATAGIDRLGDDDVAARASLRDAAGAFESAEEDLTTWWARPALAVPGVAQQARAVATMASAGADLARTAADASEDADVESIRPRNGRIDLDALVALQEPLDRSVRSLRTADARLGDVDSPVLISPLADRLETLRAEVDDALGSAELAAQVVDVVPGLFGADGPRRYFVAFQNPAEATANGGFMGNWAEIIADDGQLALVRSGRSRDLSDGGADPAGRRIEGEPEFVDVYGQSAARYWGNINFTPDHPTVGRIMAQLYPQSGGDGQLDGVIALTPQGLARFLELTGPVALEGYPEPLTPGNAARILLHEQYLLYSQDDAEDREGFLAEAVRVVFEQLTSGELPGPRALAQELGPAVDARHLQLWSRHADEQALFRRIGADGGATRPHGVDSFGIVTQNLNGNKIDWFTHRQLRYDVHWDPSTGAVDATMTATIRNEAPATGLPPSVIGWGGDAVLGQRPVADGENYMWVTAYTSHPIEEVTVDGESIGDLRFDELGHQSVRIYLSVPSQSERVLSIRTRGVVGTSSRYVLRPLRQPTVHPDSVQVQVRTSRGWEARGEGAFATSSGAVTWDDALTNDLLVVDAERSPSSQTVLDRLRYGG